jgi:HAMP domain-containing protein
MQLRARVLGLLLAAVVPSVALLAASAVLQRNRQVRQASAEIARHAEEAAAVIGETVDQVRVTLSLLARDDALRRLDAERCRALFRSWCEQNPHVLNLGIVSPAGEFLASALDVPAEAGDARARPWLQRALASGEFAVGDYQVGSITGRASVNFALPLRDPAGAVAAVLFAAIEPGWLLHGRRRGTLPESAVWMVVDARGTVLVREPDGERWTGTSVAGSPNVAAMLGGERGVRELAGVDGVLRLYSMAPVVELGDGGLYLTIGVERGHVQAGVDREFALLLGLLLAAAAGSIAIAWLVTDRTTLARIRALIDATRRLERGEAGVRVGDPGGDELSELGRAFDSMAATLRRREEERARAAARPRRGATARRGCARCSRPPSTGS